MGKKGTKVYLLKGYHPSDRFCTFFTLRVYDGLGVQPVVSQQECLSLPYNLVGIVFKFSPLAVLSCTAYFSPLWSALLSSSESLAWGWPIALCELSLWSSTLRRWTRNSSSWAKLSVMLSGLCVFCAGQSCVGPSGLEVQMLASAVKVLYWREIK